MMPAVEPTEDLSEECRTFCRVGHSLIEEAEAIVVYHQRLDTETDVTAKGVMAHALKEEYRHFLMDLECLFRSDPDWAQAAHDILFKPGPITDEDGADDEGQADDDSAGEQEDSVLVPASLPHRHRPWAI